MADEASTSLAERAASETKAETSGTPSGATVNLGGDPPVDPKAWEAAYDGPEALRTYIRQKGDDPTAWEYDRERLAKSHGDRQSEITRLQQELAALRKGEGDDPVPATTAEYMQGLNREELKKLAPKVYKPVEGEKHAAEEAFFAAAKEQGIPLGKSRKMFGAYMAGLDGFVEEPPSEQEQMASALKAAGPNGPQILGEVDDAILSMHKTQPFSDEQFAIIDTLRHQAGGMLMLHRMIRSKLGTTNPPNTDTTAADRMTMGEISAAMVSERYKRDSEYRKRIQSSYARAMGQDAGAGSAGHGVVLELAS